jgi:hypothetical protein
MNSQEARLKARADEEAPLDKRREVEGFLRRAGAGRLRHAHGRSLLDHLIGTGAILRAWSQPEWIQNAGLLHSVYSSEAYRQSLLDWSKRDELRRLVGERAERIVSLFCRLSRNEFVGQLTRRDRIPEHGIEITLADARGRERIARDEVRSLLLVLLANLAEQACDRKRGPGIWLAQVSSLAVYLRKGETPTPPVFDQCRAVVSSAQEQEARAAYTAGLFQLPSSLIEANRKLLKASATCPWVAEPFALRAYLAARLGNAVEAQRLVDQARQNFAHWSTPWDKRLTLEDWYALLRQVERNCDGARARDGRSEVTGFVKHCLSTLAGRTEHAPAA